MTGLAMAGWAAAGFVLCFFAARGIALEVRLYLQRRRWRAVQDADMAARPTPVNVEDISGPPPHLLMGDIDAADSQGAGPLGGRIDDPEAVGRG